MTPKAISVVFHNGSKYDYYFIIKELANNLRDSLNASEKTQKVRNFFSTNKERT